MAETISSCIPTGRSPPLLLIPTEIRDQVYQLVAACNKIEFGQRMRPLLDLMHINKRTRHEVLTTLIRKNTWILDLCCQILSNRMHSFDARGLHQSFTKMPSSLRTNITSITVVGYSYGIPSDPANQYSLITDLFPSLRVLRCSAPCYFLALFDDPRTAILSSDETKHLRRNRGLQTFEMYHSKLDCRECKNSFRAWVFFAEISREIAKDVCRAKIGTTDWESKDSSAA